MSNRRWWLVKQKEDLRHSNINKGRGDIIIIIIYNNKDIIIRDGTLNLPSADI